MAKKQFRIQNSKLESTKATWLGQTVSVVMRGGSVYEVRVTELVGGLLRCRDGLRLKHEIPLNEINEIILYFPVAEHAQTSAD